jgi:transketolase
MSLDFHLHPGISQTHQLQKKSARDGYGDGLLDIAQANEDVVVLSADLSESTRVIAFRDQYPDRFFELGVAEQNMMSVAAGLALSGKVPFVSSFAVFSPGRNWDQLRVSVCYSKANVKVIGAHAGLNVGPDGATHQALEDIAITRVLPNIAVVVPCDYWETRKATQALSRWEGPTYMRFGRDAFPLVTTEETPFEIGIAQVLQTGTDLSLIACGPLVYEALKAAHALQQLGIEAEVINNHTIKPLDSATLLTSVRKTRAVVTLEEHQVAGGMGSAVAELLAEYEPVPIQMIGVRDTFGESGTTQELWAAYGLSQETILAAAHAVLARKAASHS